MILRNIERFEIVVIILDVGAARDFKAHAPKDIDDFIDDECERMNASALPARSGKRDIDLLFFERARFGLFFDLNEAFVQALFNEFFELVELLAHLRPLFLGQVLQVSQKERQPSLAAEDFDAHLLDLRFGGRLLDSLQNLSSESF